MDVNIEVLDKLRVKFPGYRFEYDKPPSFISNLLQDEKDIVLCYHVKTGVNKTSVGNFNVQNKTNSKESMCSFIGKPLEVPYMLEESVLSLTLCEQPNIESTLLENNYAPIEASVAGKIMNFCHLRIKPKVAVVVLCCNNNKPNRVLRSCFHHDKWIQRSWADYYKMDSTSLPSINELLSIHNKLTNGPNEKSGMPCSVQLKCSSVIEVQNEDNPSVTIYSKMSAQFEWTQLIAKPPIEFINNAFLIADVNIGSGSFSGLSSIWNQLLLLQSYIDFLDSRNEALANDKLPSAQTVMNDLGVSFGVSDEITSKIEEFLDTARSVKGAREIEQSLIAHAIDFFSRPNRSGMELTDLIWLNFIGCPTVQKLLKSFNELFRLINTKKYFNTLLMKSNTTRFAHALFACQIQMPFDPVEYLIELGIEKLRKELMSIFNWLQMGAFSLHVPSVPKFTEVSNCEKWREVCVEWLTWFTKLYSTLEVLYNIEKALGDPPLHLLYPMVPTVLSHFFGDKSAKPGVNMPSLLHLLNNPHLTLKLPVSRELVKKTSIFETDVFDEWSMTVKSSSQYRKATSLFSRSLRCPFPHIDEEPGEICAVPQTNDTTLLNTNFGPNTTNCLSDNISFQFHCANFHSISDYFAIK